jgi:hypothetical protein
MIFITGSTGMAGRQDESSIDWKVETYTDAQLQKVWSPLKCSGSVQSSKSCL